jgi:hypothetical protein
LDDDVPLARDSQDLSGNAHAPNRFIPSDVSSPSTPERPSAQRRLKEAQNLAISTELLEYCEAQHAFIDNGTDEEPLRLCAQHLAREARRRLLEPQTLLLAMQIGECYRSRELAMESERHARYLLALDAVLTSFYGSESRPGERRMGMRTKKEDRSQD